MPFTKFVNVNVVIQYVVITGHIVNITALHIFKVI